MNNLVILRDNKKKYSILYVLFCILTSFIYFFELKIQKYNYFINSNHKYRWYCTYFVICIIISAIIYGLIKYILKNGEKIHKAFLVLALVLGLMNIFFVPMFRGADELGHFCRIFEISQGNIFTPVDKEGNTCNLLPSSIRTTYEKQNGNFSYTNMFNDIFSDLNEGDKEVYKNYYISISLYAPIQYIPQAIGFFIARKLNLNIYLIGIFGRVFGFAFWIFVCYKSIKKIPLNKVFLMLLILSPVMIGYATTLSGDMMLNSMVALLISNIYYLRCTKEKINNLKIVELALICFTISLCKVVYIPVVLCLVFIPKECFFNKKRYFIFLSVTIVISLVLAFSWYMYSSENYLNNFYDRAEMQKDFIINNPIKYSSILIRTLLNYSLVYVTHSSQVDIFPIFALILWILLIISLYNYHSGEKYCTFKNNFEKFLCIFICILIIILIETAIYIQFTAMVKSVGNDLVEGIQMRYFVPVILIISMFLKKEKIWNNDKKVVLTFLTFQIPVFLTMLINYF